MQKSGGASNLWYCSLEYKVCHLCLAGVGGMDGDYWNVRVGVGPLEGEIDFQTVLVVRDHRRDTCKETIRYLENDCCLCKVLLSQSLKAPSRGQTGQCSELTCCSVIEEGLWGEAIQEERGLGDGHRGSRGRGWTTYGVWINRLVWVGIRGTMKTSRILSLAL